MNTDHEDSVDVSVVHASNDLLERVALLDEDGAGRRLLGELGAADGLELCSDIQQAEHDKFRMSCAALNEGNRTRIDC